MTPLEFDPTTAREVCGDEQARMIEAAARADADAGECKPPMIIGATYWDQVQAQMRAIVYRAQHDKRMARNARKAARVKQ